MSGKGRWLRLLATTDVHLQMLGFDYIRDRPLDHNGLAGIATLIGLARSEARAAGMACLLLDNGDMLQGAAIEMHLTQEPPSVAHPLVRCLHALGYDAIGLGNHDLDHGLDFVTSLARHLDLPVLASNIAFQMDEGIKPWTIVSCPLPGPDAAVLKVGVISALPQKTAFWNSNALCGRAEIAPPRESAEHAANAARAAGADIVVLLAHMGMEAGVMSSAAVVDDARSLASLPGVDAMILGHTHLRLPGRDHAGLDSVDTERATLSTRPSVMAGHDASDLAVLDLCLDRDADGRWRVVGHDVQLRANSSATPADPQIREIFANAHNAARAALARQSGTICRPLHNYFSLAVPTRTAALVAQAKHRVISQALARTSASDLPLLATASAHMAGGRGGPDHFIHVPAGGLHRRQLYGLALNTNLIWALRVSGADLRDWLEHAASVYSHLRADRPDQMLVRCDRPAFDFDTIFGLEYGIDPTQPPGRRIQNMTYAGQPVADSQIFALATSHFRAAGGGGGPRFDDDKVICRTETSILSALEETLAGDVTALPFDPDPWRLSCAQPVMACLRTAPDALEYLPEIAPLSPVFRQIDADGFAVVRVSL